jgi:hypothetical protein
MDRVCSTHERCEINVKLTVGRPDGNSPLGRGNHTWNYEVGLRWLEIEISSRLLRTRQLSLQSLLLCYFPETGFLASDTEHTGRCKLIGYSAYTDRTPRLLSC